MTDDTLKDGTPVPPAQHPDQHAMQDEDLVERLEADPEDAEAQLDAALDASMDASDPPSITPPHLRESALSAAETNEMPEKTAARKR